MNCIIVVTNTDQTSDVYIVTLPEDHRQIIAGMYNFDGALLAIARADRHRDGGPEVNEQEDYLDIIDQIQEKYNFREVGSGEFVSGQYYGMGRYESPFE